MFCKARTAIMTKSLHLLVPLIMGLILAYLAFRGHTGESTQAQLVSEELDVVYGKGGDQDLKLDLFRPTNNSNRLPAVVILHGGGWQQGSKSDLRDTARWLAEEGYVTATVGYRFAPQHKFPAQIEDAKCAVRWLRANAQSYHIDGEHIGAVGLSSGAHLALLLGLTSPSDGFEGNGGHAECSSRVGVVVNVYGPTDLTQNNWSQALESVLGDLLGGDRRTHPEDYRTASPLLYVHPGVPPILTIHGTNDVIVPYQQAERLDAALRGVGAISQLETLQGAGHGETWGPEEFRRYEHATLDFLDKHLKHR
jgi:acetyl esterase/lipase